METTNFIPESIDYANKFTKVKHNPKVSIDTEPRRFIFNLHDQIMKQVRLEDTGEVKLI